MNRLCLTIALIFLATSLSIAQDKIDGKLLVGKWEPETAPQGAKVVMEFTKDNKLMVNAEFGGQKINMEGTYKLDGDKLEVKLKEPTGKEKATSLKIMKLTNDELVTKEGDEKEEKLKRVK